MNDGCAARTPFPWVNHEPFAPSFGLLRSQSMRSLRAQGNKRFTTRASVNHDAVSWMYGVGGNNWKNPLSPNFLSPRLACAAVSRETLVATGPPMPFR
jgi:hypothetical protein